MAFAGSRYGRSQQQSQLPAPHAERHRGGFTASTGAASATSPAARRFCSSGSVASAAPFPNVRGEPSPSHCPALPAREHARRTAYARSIGQSAWCSAATPVPDTLPPWACRSAARRCCTVSVPVMPGRSHRSGCSAWMIGHGARAITTARSCAISSADGLSTCCRTAVPTLWRRG
jgi:hypothetical protein